ncbi:TonB-dependent receptor [Novosphingobium sp. KN65.2]|uniref:TonB-dependent receptor n=1 Tax=Novosphingobium sp. KN65.2 TaxID=1478134 RepID=UPI0005DD21A6|nr:TonB-dependent receptor [Novosphingobium sp. KN65.2]CDO34099.1 TonB-dependent receptor [Novosphingobium sp. KN65.2]
MKFNICINVSLIAIAVAANAGQALAQTSEAAQQQASVGIEDIVVTAQKVRQNANDVGMTISVLSGDQLKNTSITTPDDLVKVVPGFSYSRSAYGTPVYTMRGVGFYDTVAGAPSTVSVYQDEVPFPYAIMTKGVAQDVQRVEVLKGPQGTLFGQNATGGAMNFIANHPTGDLEAGVDVAYSSFSKVEASGFLSGPITDTLRARISGSLVNGGAWQKSATRDDKLGDARVYTGRFLLDWEPTDRFRLKLNANGWIDNSDEQAGQVVALLSGSRASQTLRNTVAQYDISPGNARIADWDPGLARGTNDTIQGIRHKGFRRDSDFYQLSARAEYELMDDITLTSVTAYNKLRTDGLVDADGTNQNVYHVSSGARIDSFSQELRLGGKTGRLQWLVGGNYQKDNIFNYGDTFNTIGTFPFASAGSIADMHVKSLSAFANLTYELTDRIELTGGIRYTDVKIDNAGCTLDGGDGQFAAFVNRTAAGKGVSINVQPGQCVTLDPVTFRPTGFVKDSLNETNTPFKLGVNWKIGPNSLLYISASKGYKAGTFSPVGAIYSTSLAPAKQESLMAYEAGFKLMLADRVLQLNGAAFYYDYRNKQVRGRLIDPVLGSLNRTLNVPKSRITGAELQMTVVPDRSLHINFGGTYIKSEILDNFTNFTYGSVLANMEGTALPLTPKWQFTLDTDYDTPVSNNFAAFAGFHLYNQSKAYSGLGQEERFRTPDYVTLDLRVGLRDIDDKWRVTAFVNNVTNTYSWNIVAIAGPDTAVRLANPPRVFGVRLSLRN